jgi:hypothetical protein
MKRTLALVMAVSLAALLFASAFASREALAPADVAAKPTKWPRHPGQGNGQGRGRGGPCGQPAQAGDASKTHYAGVLTNVGAGSITLSTANSGTVTIDVTRDTCIRMPPRRGLSLSDLSVGQRVGVQAIQGDGGNLIAVRIQVHKPRRVTYVGTVTAYTPDTSLTLQPAGGGTPLTFALTGATDVKPWHRADKLAVGSQVTLQAVRDYVGGDPPVLRLIIHSAEDDD